MGQSFMQILDLSGPLHFTDIMLRWVQYLRPRTGQSKMLDSLPAKKQF